MIYNHALLRGAGPTDNEQNATTTDIHPLEQVWDAAHTIQAGNVFRADIMKLWQQLIPKIHTRCNLLLAEQEMNNQHHFPGVRPGKWV